MIDTGLATAADAIFDLDFHAVMHWGHDPALEKHYVPTRSQRARSVLTFFAQDTGTHNLVYANADLTKSSQNREVIAFCDHWKAASGNDPAMLIMDQKVTTHAVLGELDAPRRHLPHPAHALTRADPTDRRAHRARTTAPSPWTGPAGTTGRKYTRPPEFDSPATPAPCANSSSPGWAATHPP